MLVNKQYITRYKVSIVIECCITMLFLFISVTVLRANFEPVYLVVALIGLFVLVGSFATLCESYYEILRDIKFMFRLDVAYVVISGSFYTPHIEVHSVDHYCIRVYGVTKVYNKDVDKALIDREKKVLYIPYKSNIYWER